VLTSEREELKDRFTLQATAEYMFYQALCQTQYSIGSKVRCYLEGALLLESQAEFDWTRLREFVVEVKEDLLAEHNCGRAELADIIPFCHYAVEKYLFEELSPTLARLFGQESPAPLSNK
jgi:hypothetical protein